VLTAWHNAPGSRRPLGPQPDSRRGDTLGSRAAMTLRELERSVYRSLFGELSPPWVNSLRNWSFFLLLFIGPLIARYCLELAYMPDEPPEWVTWPVAGLFFALLFWIWWGQNRD
jgi:hypothetical protein